MSSTLTMDRAGVDYVRYRLIPNGAVIHNTGAETYSAVVEVKEIYGLEDLADRMVENGCMVRKSGIVAVLSELANLTARLMTEGRSVNIPGLVRFTPAIRGVFNGPEDVFDPKRHKVVVNAMVGRRMHRAAKHTRVLNAAKLVVPEIKVVLHGETSQANRVTCGQAFMVVGTHLLWDTQSEEEGFFLLTADGEVRCEVLTDNQEPGENAHILELKAPETLPEHVTLLFRTSDPGTLHEITYDDPLTVL